MYTSQWLVQMCSVNGRLVFSGKKFNVDSTDIFRYPPGAVFRRAERLAGEGTGFSTQW